MDTGNLTQPGAQKRKVQVAVAAYPVDRLAHWSDWEAKTAAWVADVADADLLVFPEYGSVELASLSGASGTGLEMDAVDKAAPRAWDHWAALAQAHNVHILAPSGPVRREGRYVNRAMFIAPSGKRVAHDKRMLTPWERRPMALAQGGAPILMQTEIGRIGVQICYDCEFPLATRALAQAGMDLLLVPSQTETRRGFNRVRIGAMARALEAQCFVLHAPTQGQATWSSIVDKNTGRASIYGPPDIGFAASGILAEGAMDRPGWTRATLDLEALGHVRDRGEVRGLRDWDDQIGAQAVPVSPVQSVDLR